MRQHHAEVLIPNADAFCQLAAEKDWLCGKNQRSLFSPLVRDPPREWTDIAKHVEEVLARPELVKFLCVLEKHNSNLLKQKVGAERKVRAAPFLLGYHLFYILLNVKQRKANLAKMPVLGQQPAEIRSHFHEAAAKAKALARLVRKGPQPPVALAARHRPTETIISLFEPCRMIRSPDRRKAIVSLDRLLDDAAASLEEVSGKISHTRWHRKTGRKQLRHWAIGRLASAFRERLNHPYHSHIATIVTVLTDIDTDEDYVKKIDKRRPGGHNS